MAALLPLRRILCYVSPSSFSSVPLLFHPYLLNPPAPTHVFQQLRFSSSSSLESSSNSISSTRNFTRERLEKSKPSPSELALQEKRREQYKEKALQKEAELQEGEYVNPATGEIGGPRGLEPTRYGDWGFKGRVTDF